ncbi:TonB-dependent receptor [Kineobactrum salinum]|uniref:TonB-dependent receptor n=1 Tax=Kineobactrum salinum TaxID=2708301 RepID=A0A6C0TX82_9GAMM|nr:TonB-dependent receptor [Kineobactrum salinum]QIB64432.1 TonB-dependent receptor [Kineobactrum salinum]
MESLTANLDDLNAYESNGVRGQLLLRPTDALEVLVSADASKERRDGPGRTTGEGLALGAVVASLPADLQPGFFENLQSVKPHADTDTLGLSIQADWSVEWGTLTSITAYRSAEADVSDLQPAVDFAYFPIVTVDNFFQEDGEQFSQELRFASQATDTLFWQAGLFYLKEEIDRDEFFDAIIGAPLGGAPTGTALARGGNFQTNETQSLGAFGQLTWSIGDSWDLTLGGRYTSESKDAGNRSLANGVNILEVFDIEADESWNAFTPKLALSYYLGDISIYATASSGFKSGGFQGSAPTELAAITPFDEEKVINYEAGIKGTVFDNNLRFNLAAFYTEYEDLQVLIQTVGPGGIPGPNLTENAGEAESQGAELEVQWQMNGYLQLAASYAYLDTEYTHLEGNLMPNEGNRLRNAPRMPVP